MLRRRSRLAALRAVSNRRKQVVGVPSSKLAKLADSIERWPAFRLLRVLEAVAVMAALIAFVLELENRSRDRVIRIATLYAQIAQTIETPGGAAAVRASVFALAEERVPLSRLHLPGVDLMGIDLRRVPMEYVNLTKANLQGANLAGVDLFRAELSGVNFKGAILSGARLDYANLSENVNMIGANLADASMFQVNLAGADMKGANLSGAFLNGADFTGVYLGPKMTTLMDFEVADLSNADLSNAILSGANFQRANLDGVNFSGACYIGVPPYFSGGHSVPECDVSN